MGNCCTKSTDLDSSTAGRPLGTLAPSNSAKPATSIVGGVINQPTSTIPRSAPAQISKNPKPKVTGPGRTLGGSDSGSGSGGGGGGGDARAVAARAAEARAARLMAEKEEEYSRWASNRRIAEKSSAAQRGPTTREALAWN